MPQTEPTPLQLITLVIAVLGLALSLASLVWQISQFFLSGYRVKVQLKIGALAGDSVITGPFMGDLLPLLSQGFASPIVVVEARNVGRQPVTIKGFGVQLANGFGYSEPGGSNPKLPYRLEAGEHVAFYATLKGVSEMIAAGSADVPVPRRRIRAQIDLATGKTISSKWSKLRPDMS